MFGMGGTEILVILIVALLFLGPEKLPEAAKKISSGIRDIRKQTRDLQSTIENDERIGGALRDLRSALRDEPAPRPLPKPAAPPPLPSPLSDAGTAAATALAGDIANATSTESAVGEGATDPNLAPVTPATAPDAIDAPIDAPIEAPSVTLPPTAGEGAGAPRDLAELAARFKPAEGAVAKTVPASGTGPVAKAETAQAAEAITASEEPRG